MEQLLSHLVKTNISLSVELGTRPMAIGDILNLKVGDTLELDRSAGDSIPVKVEGIPKFLAYPGHSNSRRAVQVLRRVKKEDLESGKITLEE
jgi:flagellar motor switch protein FliM